ncbi:MAG: serine hydrolase domain-containing protein, partial [Pseudomonadota bacterium]
VDAPIATYFPDRSIAQDSPLWAIDVEHLLTMSSGLASDDDEDDSPGSEGHMASTDNYVDFVLGLPKVFEPGDRFAYSSAVAFLLGSVVENASRLRRGTVATNCSSCPKRISWW